MIASDGGESNPSGPSLTKEHQLTMQRIWEGQLDSRLVDSN